MRRAFPPVVLRRALDRSWLEAEVPEDVDPVAERVDQDLVLRMEGADEAHHRVLRMDQLLLVHALALVEQHDDAHRGLVVPEPEDLLESSLVEHLELVGPEVVDERARRGADGDAEAHQAHVDTVGAGLLGGWEALPPASRPE